MKQKHVNFSTQKGLTLVELLIASVLGLLIVGIVGSMYVTSVGGFRTAKELSRVQENTRFALHFMNQSLRQAGYSQCGNLVTKDYSFLTDNFNSSIDGGIVGWEFNGTDVGETFDYDLVANTGVGVATNWASQPGSPALTELIAKITNDPIKGSDIFAVTLEQERNDVVITSTSLDTISATGTVLPQRAIVKVGDCFERNIFSKTNAATGTADIQVASGSGNTAISARPRTPEAFTTLWGAGTRVFSDVTTFYYIAIGESGLPSLFRTESECGFQIAVCEDNATVSGINTVELVEGVENMQLMYGVDSTDDGVANRYFSADDVTAFNFADVVTIRLSLLVRASERSEKTDITSYTLADTVIIDPVDQGVLRYVVNTTIELRNRADQ